MRVKLRFSICGSVIFTVVALFAAARVEAAEPLPFRRAIDLALRHSTTMAIASADQVRARAAVNAGRNLFLPRLEFGSGAAWTYGYPLSIEGSAPTIFNVQTQQFLFNPAQREFLRSYESQWHATGYLSDDKKNQVVLETATDYIELDIATSMLSILQQEGEAAQHAEQVVSSRVKEGVDTEVELNKARLANARVRVRTAQAQSTADLLRERLSQLTGLPTSEIQTASESIPKLPEINQEENLVARAVEYSPAIKVADQQAEARHFSAKGEHKALYPSIDISGQYGYFAKYNNFQDFFKKFQRNNAVYGLVIRVPVFNSAQKARAEAADADALIARKQAQEVKDQVSSDALRLQRSLRQLTEAKEVARLEHELAISDVEAAQAHVQAGTATIKDQELARVHEHQTYIAFLDAAFARDKAQMELMRSTGELQRWAIAPEAGTVTATPANPNNP